MEGQLVSWLISLITGGVGGNVAGALFKNLSLGTLSNTLVGAAGGGIGGQLLTAALGLTGPSGILGNLLGSGVGSIVLTAGIGFIKSWLAEK